MAIAQSDSVIVPVVNGGNGTLEDEFINGLVQGGSWLFSGPRQLTYSFNLNDNGTYPEGAAAPGDGGTWAASPQIATAVTQALAAWSSVANITFQHDGSTDSANYYFQSTADLSFTLTGSDLQSVGAYALGFFPDPQYTATVLAPYTSVQYPYMEGNIFLDNYAPTPLATSVAAGSAGFWIILHEIGHALGLKHTADDGGNAKLTFSQLGISAYDSMQYTMMVPATTGSTYAATPMPLDILAIQHIYGANTNFNTGNNTYALNSGYFGTIWDAGGTDTIDATSWPGMGGAFIDLSEGAFSGVKVGEKTTAIAYNAVIENAIGSSGDDSIFGNAAANSLLGGGGSDSFVAGAGQDTLIGGAGDDSYEVDGLDLIIEDEDSGQDSVFAWASFVLPDHVESLRLFGSEGINGDGNVINNTLNGNVGNNYLSGHEGNDYLDGGNGSDTLDGGSGADYMVGGYGDDFFLIDNPGDIITDAADELSAVNIAFSSVSYTLPINVELITLALSGPGPINGSGNNFNNWLKGNSASNVLTGNNGSDTLEGSGGADILIGGRGNDLFIVDAADVVITEYLSEGIDIVLSSISCSLPAHVENLTLSGVANVNASGNALSNVLVGNAAANVLDGGAGIDSLVGGSGDDTYIVDANIPGHFLDMSGEPGEFISEGQSFSFDATDGNFIVSVIEDMTGDGLIDYLAFTYSSPNSFGVWSLTFSSDRLNSNLSPGIYSDAQRAPNASAGHPGLLVSGNGVNPSSIYGSFVINDIQVDYAGPDPVLLNFEVDFVQRVSSSSAPRLSGTLHYEVESTSMEPVVELSGEGNDRIVSSVNAVLPDYIESLQLTGSGHLRGSGNATDNIISGNSGNNILDGAAGADIIAGGPGNDTYVVDNSGDQVMELGNSGIDAVQSGVSYDLMQAWHVENLTLTGGSAVNGSGNWLDNLITGNSAANVLTGNRGNDTINGGGGSDTLVGGLGDDVLVWDAVDAAVQGGAGSDTLLIDGSGVTLNPTLIADTLITDVEVVDLTGSGNNTLTLALADVLAISSASEVLRVDGNSGDAVNAGAGWTGMGNQVIGAQNYAAYVQGVATLLVDSDIAVSLV